MNKGGFDALIEEVVANKVERLQFRGLVLNLDRVEALSHALNRNTSVNTLILFNQKIGPEGMRSLSPSLSTRSLIVNLNLCSCGLGSEGAVALSNGLGVGVQKLDLSDNDICSKGCEALAEAFAHKCPVSELSLSRNKIGPCGVRALANGANHLSKLVLNHNNIGDEGVALFASSFPSLQHLSLCGNNIGDVGCYALCRRGGMGHHHHHHHHLTYLNLDYNHVGREGAQALMTHLHQLKQLHLNNNNLIMQDDDAFLAKVLEQKNGMLLQLTFHTGSEQHVQKILDDNRCMHERALATVSMMLLVCKFRKTDLSVLPKDVTQIIAKDLWNSRVERDFW